MPRDLYGLIEERGLSLRELARRIDLSHSMLSQGLRGVRTFSPAALERLARELDLTPLDLLSRLGVESSPATGDPLRERLLRDVSVRADLIEVVVEVDERGTTHIERRYLRCRPTQAGRRAVLTFRERALGAMASKPEDVALQVEPAGYEYQTTSMLDGPWRSTKLVFSPRADDAGAFSVRLQSAIVDSATLGGPRPEVVACGRWSCQALFVPVVADRLRLDLTLPEAPLAWEPRAWFGPGPMGDEMTALTREGPCAAVEFEAEARHATLLVIAPVSCYTYAIAWLPKESA